METNSTMNVEVVYEETMELLDESKHYDNKDLVKIINQLIKRQ